jgi:DHA2 family multidrug resistance protein-like MFS transporter
VADIPALSADLNRQIHDSIGRALIAAQSLPEAQQKLIRAAADHAYITSMRLAYGIAAAVILLAALVSWRWLPAQAPNDSVADEQVMRGETPAVLEN